jgi:hypothetical protein
MRYDKKDRAKIVALAAILIVLWGFIGVRFALLSRAHKAQARARQQARDAARPQTAAAPNASESTAVSPALRLAALVAPVPPPKSDPFHPVIAPRSTESTPQPLSTRKRSREPEQAPPVLPPLPGSPSGGRGGDRLQLTGIIVGTPSTAVLRLGEDHYVVREGDVLDTTLHVQKITKTTVTLRDGRAAYTLRLGG